VGGRGVVELEEIPSPPPSTPTLKIVTFFSRFHLVQKTLGLLSEIIELPPGETFLRTLVHYGRVTKCWS
jgi:hypothetical protein